MNDMAIATLGEVPCFEPATSTQAGPSAIEAYQRDGVICLRGAYGRDWVEVIESGVEMVMSRSTRMSDVGAGGYDAITTPGEKGQFFYDSMMWKKVEPFRRFIFDSPAPDLYRSILETDALTFYYDFLILKGPFCDSGVTPWHQDHSYYPFNGRQIINCWTALDPIPVETALRFVKGSHHRDAVFQATHFNPEKSYENEMSQRPPVPDFEAHPEEFEIISCAMEPGDTLVWNSRTFHTAPGNHLSTRRAALSTNWLGDDVTYNDIPQETDPPARGENLVQGGPVACETFPRVR